MLKEGKAEEALDVLELALGVSGATARARCTLLANSGLCLEQLGRLEDAVQALESAVASDRTNAAAASMLMELKASALLNKAVAAAEENELERALELFTAAGAADPEGDGMWRYNAAVMLNKLGRFEEALAAVEAYRSSSDEEGSAASLALFGELLCKANRWSSS